MLFGLVFQRRILEYTIKRMSNVPSNFCVVAPLGLAVFGLFHASESVALG